MKSLIELTIEDANIMIGQFDTLTMHASSGGIYLWNHQEGNPRPSIDMTAGELEDIILGKSYLKIPYKIAREVYVDDISVWKNSQAFDLEKLGIDEQNFLGFGEVRTLIFNEPYIRKILSSAEMSMMRYFAKEINI